MLKQITQIKDRVEHLLKNYPQLRDDDKKLWLAYLNVFCDMKSRLESGKEVPYEVYKEIILDPKTPSFESLGRSRRKFQEAGKYIGEKRKERLEEADAMNDWAIQTEY